MKRPERDSGPWWWAGLKLAGCGALIAAIGFAIAVVGTSGEVTESHADIAWLSSFDRSNTERFDTALDHLGHPAPSRYDLNGNAVYFSAHTSRKRPHQVMAEYQEEFRRQGLNDRVYVDLDEQDRPDRLRTALTGGIVPFAITPERIAMRGVVTANEASNADELAQLHRVADNRHEAFRAHRYIEISRPADRRHTSIVATWSDESFDFEKMLPHARTGGQSFDATIPPCPRCTRVGRFADDERRTGQGRVQLSFLGPDTVDATRQFYARTLGSDGWQRQPLDGDLRTVERTLGISMADGNTDRYRRDRQELMLTFSTDDRTGQTLTVASSTPASGN